MSESPWKSSTSSMSSTSSTSTGAHAARPPANWGFFLLMSIVIGIAAAVVEWGLTQANVNLGPLVNLASTVAVTWVSGAAWLKKAGGSWDSQDRHRLAFAYTMVNLVFALLLFGLIFALMGSPVGQEMFAAMGLEPEMLAAGATFVGIIFVIAIPIGLLIGYGIMRLVLYYVVGKGRDSTAQADTFS